MNKTSYIALIFCPILFLSSACLQKAQGESIGIPINQTSVESTVDEESIDSLVIGGKNSQEKTAGIDGDLSLGIPHKTISADNKEKNIDSLVIGGKNSQEKTDEDINIPPLGIPYTAKKYRNESDAAEHPLKLSNPYTVESEIQEKAKQEGY